MKVQDMINELQTILKEHGNLELVTRTPLEGVSRVGIYAEEAKEITICSNDGYYSTRAIKVCPFE